MSSIKEENIVSNIVSNIEEKDIISVVDGIKIQQSEAEGDMIKYVGASGSSCKGGSVSNYGQNFVVNSGGVTAEISGYVRVNVVDNNGNLTAKYYYQPLYTLS